MSCNVFILTSSVHSTITRFHVEYRIEQVLQSIKKIREKDPSAVLILVENSLGEKDADLISMFKAKVDFFISDKDVFIVDLLKRNINSLLFKGMLETHALIEALKLVRSIIDKVSVKRIFKITGRYKLMDTFDFSYYDNLDFVGKYVFKNRLPTWFPDQNEIPFVLLSFFWSFSADLLQNTIDMLYRVFYNALLAKVDVEHLLFDELRNSALIEIPIVHVSSHNDFTGEFDFY